VANISEKFTASCHQGNVQAMASTNQKVLMMEAVSSSEMSINIHKTTWHYIPEDSHLHTYHCENLKSHTDSLVFNNTNPHTL
jgi:hypothetical protein